LDTSHTTSVKVADLDISQVVVEKHLKYLYDAMHPVSNGRAEGVKRRVGWMGETPVPRSMVELIDMKWDPMVWAHLNHK